MCVRSLPHILFGLSKFLGGTFQICSNVPSKLVAPQNICQSAGQGCRKQAFFSSVQRVQALVIHVSHASRRSARRVLSITVGVTPAALRRGCAEAALKSPFLALTDTEQMQLVCVRMNK